MSAYDTAETGEWDVRTERDTVVVELPGGLTLDGETGKQINEAFAEATGKRDTSYVLTLLGVEDALGSGVFDEVKNGADLAASNGIDRWAIVVEAKIKGMAFESQIDDLETGVFEDAEAARSWLSS